MSPPFHPPWHRHHRHRRRFRDRRRWPFAWQALHGVHKRLVGFLLLAMAVGGAGGAAAHAAIAHGLGHVACVTATVALAAWPLGWIATVRIVRPLRELARVAGELQGGALTRRTMLAAARDDEVGEVAVALRGMADRVARQLDDQRALMAAVSHELRSPLGRLRVLVELLREGSAPPGAHDDLQAEIDGMDALVGDLLAASRIDFEALAPRRLAARDVVARAVEVARLGGVAVEDRAEGAAVSADATLLARALSGLLDNARRYGAGHVVLRIERDAERIRFAVCDDGPGFGPGEAEQAFEPFWRGPPGADGRRPRGEGLGLALVRQIARAHGGEAGAGNQPEGGACVWVSLPEAR
ncbi:MAG: HAMP domain-containing sensor histidine kinase [Myxococcota bacterium]